MSNFRFKITQKDIDKANSTETISVTQSCPIYQAANRQLVGLDGVRTDFKGNYYLSFKDGRKIGLPPLVSQRAETWDRTNKMFPFAFDVDIPAENIYVEPAPNPYYYGFLGGV